MRRPWQVWFVFALGVTAMIPALLWLSFRTLALEKEQLLAQAKAVQLENIASVLLRLDSQVAPLLTRERTRPYYDYEPTHRRPVTMVNNGKNELIVVEEASPLVQEPQSDVILHFEIFADGVLTCPEAVADDIACDVSSLLPPEKVKECRSRLSEISRTITYEALSKRLPHAPPPTTKFSDADNYAWQGKVLNLESQRQQRMQQAIPEVGNNAPATPGENAAAPQAAAPSTQALSQAADESLNRAAYNQVSRSKMIRSNPNPAPAPLDQTAQMAAAPPEEVVREGSWEPLWFEEKLLLVRPVQRRQFESLQVCWLDWETLRGKLIEEARTLIPQASLRPVDTRDPEEELASLDLMATLPLSLVAPPPAITDTAFSSVLIMAWSGFFMAALVVGLLLYSVLSLSERRAAFVTSVTHELRTPLTTFRMYAEMLSEGMVPDERSRRRYLETLRTEADRLGHLVENVLSYARLERGRGGKARETFELTPLLERTIARLAERAHQSGKTLLLEIDKGLDCAAIRSDPGAVEQIVMNLIDNACKYAQPASDARILVSLTAIRNGGFCIAVRDFGPGISRGLFTGLFQPFSKTAQEAAVTAPGVGLGLALCRRLARQLGGQLLHRNAPEGGALLELRLP